MTTVSLQELKEELLVQMLSANNGEEIDMSMFNTPSKSAGTHSMETGISHAVQEAVTPAYNTTHANITMYRLDPERLDAYMATAALNMMVNCISMIVHLSQQVCPLVARDMMRRLMIGQTNCMTYIMETFELPVS